MGIGEARDLGEVMSAGQSLRRQNYSFPVIVTQPTTTRTTSTAMRYTRIVVAIVLAIVLDVATFATVTTLLTGN